LVRGRVAGQGKPLPLHRPQRHRRTNFQPPSFHGAVTNAGWAAG